ncbi:diguanylate cyclase [Motiliproteus coralliicola]|uniref:Diguanylate cyclase n=2 Tax=Motiliproteus coralliicola TaxID=2283196 RepID=A0A369WH38_9GAMM|nr:diguanylate cyclase [Motiliproteus coralliicola]
MAMPLSILHQRLSNWILVAIALLLAALSLLWLIISTASERQDQDAAEQYRQQVDSALSYEIEVLGTHAMDAAWWDEAIRNLVLQPDPDWGQSNIGSYLDEEFGIQISMAIDQHDRLLQGFVDSAPMPHFKPFADSRSLAILIQQARASSLQDPEGFGGLIEVAGQLYVAGVAPFTTEEVDDDDVRSGELFSVLVFLKRFDADYVEGFSERFSLQLTGIRPGAGENSLPMTTVTGNNLGHLYFSPPTPGLHLIDSILQPVLLFSTVLGAMFLLNAYFSFRTAQLNQLLDRERKQLQQTRFELEINQQIIGSIKEGVVVADDQYLITYTNPAFSRITGYSDEEVIGKRALMDPKLDVSKELYQQMQQEIDEQGYWEQEINAQRKDGQHYTLSMSVSPLIDQGQRSNELVGIFTDVTERKRQEQLLEQLANQDTLTELLNRRSFKQRVEQKIERAGRHPDTRLALLFIDLDLFKEVNDSFGHEIGDQLLIEIAGRIRRCLRAYDTVGHTGFEEAADTTGALVGRVGGDEFTVAIDELTGQQDLERVVQRLLEQIEQPLVLARQQVAVTASIGVAIFPEDGRSYDDLIRHADKAMYRSKQGGRNRSCYYSDPV